MVLTKREQELLNYGKEKGCLYVQDFANNFSMNYYRGIITKFLSLGLIKSVEGDKFEIVQG